MNSEERAVQSLCDQLLSQWSAEVKPDPNLLLSFVRSRVAMGRDLGLLTESDLRSFVALEFGSACRFASDSEVQQLFARSDLPRNHRVLTVCDWLSPEAWFRIHVTNPPIRLTR